MIDNSKCPKNLTSVMLSVIKQKLTTISNYLHGSIQYLQNSASNTDNVQSILKKTLIQLNSIDTILLRIKGFNLEMPPHFEYISIKKIFDDIDEFIHVETALFTTHINYYFNRTLPDILVDVKYIQQVFLHLIRNSIEAMRDANIKYPKLIIEANQINSDSMEICVTDNGPGVSIDILPKIFSPYFTTKKYGIGVGLSICQYILNLHNSNLEIENIISGGACFKFILPTKK